MHLLVIGCGSIGKRHLANLRQLGVDTLSAVDTRQDRLDEAARTVPGLRCHTVLDTALKQQIYAGIIICPPTAYHVPIALQTLRHWSWGANILMEKPLSHSRTGLDDLRHALREKDKWLMVAYSLRFHPGILKMKALLDEEAIGRVLSVRAECGQYLPDWHPNEDYRAWYMGKEEQGGGAILDISHEIDYLRWFFGEVDMLAASVTKISDLDINTDDCSDLLIQFRSGVVGSLHVDLLQRAYRRTCLITGTEGTILWNYTDNAVQLYTAKSREGADQLFDNIEQLKLPSSQWELLPYPFERNEQYLAEMKHFLDCLRNEATPLVDFESGRRTLEVVLAAKQASRERRWIALYPERS